MIHSFAQFHPSTDVLWIITRSMKESQPCTPPSDILQPNDRVLPMWLGQPNNTNRPGTYASSATLRSLSMLRNSILSQNAFALRTTLVSSVCCPRSNPLTADAPRRRLKVLNLFCFVVDPQKAEGTQPIKKGGGRSRSGGESLCPLCRLRGKSLSLNVFPFSFLQIIGDAMKH